MKCRSCGQINEERNKFCGECGAPMQEERRRAERRIIAWEPQQCRSCGSMNGAANRFCGMCGTALESERRQADRRALVETPNPSAPRRPEPIKTPRIEPTKSSEKREQAQDEETHDEATSYLGAPSPSSAKPRSEWVRSSGSSFLGLEDEAPANSDYLLADEEPKGGGGGRVLIALLILAAVGYLIFKNWDSPTFAAALSQLHKHTDSSSTPESKPPSPTAEQPSISTDENASSADTTKQPAPTLAPEPNKATPTEPPPASAPESIPKTADDANSKNGSSAKTPATDDQDTETAPDAAEPAPKASAKSNPPSNDTSTPSSSATPGQELYERGQAYLSGHGAPQSCDQGVVYTRAAAQQGNPKAAVQMGALYATGRCVSQDRVQAYNWFNEALRNDPNNEYVERSRSTLWAQMTSEERQRASKEQQ